MSELRHLELNQILRIHQQVLSQHGGADGIRSQELLESALNAPRASFGGKAIFSQPVEAAASHLYCICSNNPFIDGNKRVALASCLVFLKLNGVEPEPDSKKWEDLTLEVAASKLDRQETYARLKQLVK